MYLRTSIPDERLSLLLVVSTRLRWNAGISIGSFTDSFVSNTGLVVFCVGSALQCGARKFSDLVMGRAIGGFGVGALR